MKLRTQSDPASTFPISSIIVIGFSINRLDYMLQ